jgi:hypothetical protein
VVAVSFLRGLSFPSKFRNSFPFMAPLQARLLPAPNPNSIGNFFRNQNDQDQSTFIQCYMIRLSEIGNYQYGVGYPVDMPVMLTYFEDDKLLPVRETFPDYDHLVSHVGNQLEGNDFLLCRTPIVLTLQGEFEDDTMNEVFSVQERVSNDELLPEDVLGKNKGHCNYFEESENADPNCSQSEKEPPGSNLNTFWNSSPAAKQSQLNEISSLQLYRPKVADVSDIPLDAFVTEEDSESLQRDHQKAEKLIRYAVDMKLIASFHYKKRNFHLVKLLEVKF